MTRRKKPAIPTELLIGFIVPSMAFVSGIALKGLIEKENLVTKPYVDEGLANGRKYTDERTVQMLEKAIAHADMNRKENALLIERNHSELRSQMAAQGATLNLVLESVRNLDRTKRSK